MLLLTVIILSGCATSPLPPQIKIIRFDPVIDSPQVKSFVRANETYISFESDGYAVDAAVFESQAVIFIPLTVYNNTGKEILPADYSFSLHDGRDLKTIKMLTRDEISNIKAKLEGRPGGVNIETQVINTAMDSFMDLAGNNGKASIIKAMGYAVDNYFSFRPIYPREKRTGVLCFLLNFKAEYPITLKMQIRGGVSYLRFMPRQE